MRNVERFDLALRSIMVATAALVGSMGLLVWWELAAWRQLGYLAVAHIIGVGLCIALLKVGIRRIVGSAPVILMCWGISLLGSWWAPQDPSSALAATPVVIALSLGWGYRRPFLSLGLRNAFLSGQESCSLDHAE